MPAASGVATAVVFVWLGMVLAISFLEAPLKFRAPGITVRLGLGIGRLVFRALNAVEVVLAVVVAVASLAADPPPVAVTAFVLTLAVLAAQLLVVRPRLTRRSDAVLAGDDGSRSRAHLGYVALELVKVVALAATGVALLVG
jgi:hypothetical protein